MYFYKTWKYLVDTPAVISNSNEQCLKCKETQATDLTIDLKLNILAKLRVIW